MKNTLDIRAVDGVASLQDIICLFVVADLSSGLSVGIVRIPRRWAIDISSQYTNWFCYIEPFDLKYDISDCVIASKLDTQSLLCASVKYGGRLVCFLVVPEALMQR